MNTTHCECLSWARINSHEATHHPRCAHYNDSLIDVWKVSFGDSYYYTSNELDALAEKANYESFGVIVAQTKMHQEVFDNLPEFEGF